MTPEKSVGSPMTAQQILDREFLEVRARIVKIAATLDRIDRSAAPTADAERMELIRQGLLLLLGNAPDRARQVQMLFSLPYQTDWPQRLGVPLENRG
ncbi:MAG: hypothetical protein Q8M16_00840 [Pirellulaceae bacterium]|nr:hypothetical protein [Pirellulaceae bacterium]